MKKTIAKILAVIMTSTILVGCSAEKKDVKNVPTAEITSKITENVEMRKTGPVEGDMLKDMFYLNADDYEEASVLKGMMNTGLETVAVVKAKEGKVEAVKASFEKVKEDKKKEAFYPGEPEAVDASQIKTVGNYVGFFLIPDYEEGQNNVEKAVTVFEESLK